MSVPRSYTFDAALQLKTAGLVAASAAATVNGEPKVLNLGSKNSVFGGVAVIDVDAIEVASGDELYRIIIQAADTADFSGAKETLAELTLGAGAVRPGGSKTSIAGRYELPFLARQANEAYQFVRAYTEVSGAVATGINWRAFVAPLSMGAY